MVLFRSEERLTARVAEKGGEDLPLARCARDRGDLRERRRAG